MRRAASSRCTGSEKFTFSDSRDSPEKTWHWRKPRCGFFAHGNRCAGYMTCGPGPLSWTVRCSGAEGAHSRRAVVRSFFGLACMTCGAWPPCHKVGSLVHAGGDFTRDASGARVGGSTFKKGVDLSGSRHVSLLLQPSRLSAFRASIWGAPVFFGGICIKAVFFGDFTAGERALVVAPLVLFSSCCCWRGATPWELASFHHHSASRIFIMQPGCSPTPVVIQKDDYQPCGGEKQARLWPPSCPQLQGCSSSVLGRRVCRVGAPPPRG
jgi:hypothetical protein